MGPMIVRATPLAGLFEIPPACVEDARGRFSRLFSEHDFAQIRPGLQFSQVNLSETKTAGTVRGMHYQLPPFAEAKLVRCLRGRVFDVAVDVRTNSSTFLQWYGMSLEENGPALFIPEGFAHGFQTLSENVQMLYMHSQAWTPGSEAGLRYDDPRLDIAWPMPSSVVSKKDQEYSLIDGRFSGIRA